MTTATTTITATGRSVNCPGRGHPLCDRRRQCRSVHRAATMPFADPEKARAYNAAYYQANKERLRAQNEAWKAENRDYHLQLQRDWYQRNREEVRKKQAALYAEDPEPAKARTRQWAKDNPERKRAALRAWSKTPAGRALAARVRDRTREQRREESREYQRQLKITNPEKYQAISHRNASARRARKLGAPEIDKIDRRVVFERDQFICQLCGRPTDPNGESGDRPSVDHIIPLSRGGSHTYANVQTTHLTCNRYKHNKLESEL